MKLTKETLKRIIKEEIENVLREEDQESLSPEEMEQLVGLLTDADGEFVRQGIAMAENFMSPEEIIEIAFKKDGWKEEGVNWILLEQFPESEFWKSFTVLDLSANELYNLPESIGIMTELTELEIYKNKLTSLPDSIGNLTQLTKLSLHQNNSMLNHVQNLVY